MPIIPPASLVARIHQILHDLLTLNPAATSSEAYVQNYLEFTLISVEEPEAASRYFLRIGINYHGAKVQHIEVDKATGRLKGWNPTGDALAIGRSAKMLLAGHTILPRDPGEPHMNDSKIGGGTILSGSYVRTEFKARGWLGKTKNLDGKQLEKDIDLLKNDRADLLIICLSETAHRKWRGEGPPHQVARRTGVSRFLPILVPVSYLNGTDVLLRDIVYEGQEWTVSTQRVIGAPSSIMPGAEHYVTLCWRRA
ncbi:MAG TPA: hypothetical protein VJK02_00735 [Anaerolineales bacterium]|nr:hypothetical protein [Anaerolineales bacterium]